MENKKIPNRILSDKLRFSHETWKQKSLKSQGYFVVFNSFLEEGYLRNLSGGAVKLFIYLGIVSKNNSGESFHSVESMAKYFGVSKKTIYSWINELEEASLLTRMQLDINAVSHTFLRPY